MQVAKILRMSGIIFGSILGTLLLAAFIVPPFLDWNEYRDEVEGISSKLLNKQVKIDGDLEISLLPVPTLRVSDLHILAPDTAKNIATIGSLDVAMSAMALLYGDLKVSTLTLSAIDLSLIQSQSGDWSVEGLVGGDGAAGSKGFQLDDFRIKDSVIKLIQSDGTTTDVSNLVLDVQGMVPQGPITWSGSARVHDVPFSLSGRLQSLSNGIDKSIKLAAGFANSTAELNGTLAESGDFLGRLTVSSENAALFEQSLYRLAQLPATVQLPTQPLEIDARLNFSGVKGYIETKRLMLGDTTARAEVTLLGKEKQHFSARLDVGMVNLDEWHYLATEKIATKNTVKSNKNNMLFGDIELSVDVIEWHGKAVRQIDVALGLDGETVTLTKMQALVPGGGTLSLGGVYRTSGDMPSFAGRMGLKTGGLKDLLAWFGTDVSQLPADRLMSLDWHSAMILDNNRFRLDEISARIDDSSLKGTLSFADDFALSGVDLAINKINLDAYMPKSAAGTDKSPEGTPFKAPEHVKLSVGELIFKETRLNKVLVEGDKPEIGPVLVSASANAFGGTVGLSGRVNSLMEIEPLYLTVVGNGLNKMTLLNYFGQANAVSRSVGGGAIDLAVRLDGTLDNLLVDADIKSGSDKLNAKGGLSIVDNALTEMDLLGKLELAQSKNFMQSLGVEGAKGPIGLDLTATGKLDGDIALRLAGAVAGSELIANGVWTSGAEGSGAFKGDVKLAFGALNSLPTSLQYMPALADLRLKSDIDYGTTLLALNNIDVALAGGRITGGVKLSGPEYKNIAGTVVVAGVHIEDAETEHATLSQPWSKQNFHPLPTSGMVGSLGIDIQSLSYKGQDIANSKGALVFSGSGLAFTFSQLTLNGAPAKFALSVADDKEMRQFDMQVDATSIRMAPLLKSLTGSVVTDGTAKFSMNASGAGGSAHSLVSSLKGQGELQATAGTFKFLNLVKLAGALRNPASGMGAIQSVGSMLGQGNTSFSRLDGTMMMDKGIVNITQMNGAGDWGTLTLTGPVNLVQQEMDLSGAIFLSQPQDVPEIGMSFKGPVTQPRKKFATDTLLRYVLTKVNILRKQEAQEAGETQVSPTEALVGKAFDLLGKLKKKEEEKKKDN